MIQKTDDKARNSRLIRKYVKERDDVVLSMDVDRFRKFTRKWNPELKQPSDEVMEITLRKMALSIPSMPWNVQQEAREWLIAHNCEPKGVE